MEGAGHIITVDYGRERALEALAEWMDMYQRAEGGGRRAETERRRAGV
jgi:hypothetical protein